jgi:biopolymer transport protein ExbD
MPLKAFEKDDFHAPNAEINTTPLVDVMLVLMVIFLVTAPMLEQSIRLELPKTASVSVLDTKSITVSITKNGDYYWDSNAISKTALTQKLQETKNRDPKQQILIRADADVKYSSVAFVLAEASRNGLTNVGFAVDGNKN